LAESVPWQNERNHHEYGRLVAVSLVLEAGSLEDAREVISILQDSLRANDASPNHEVAAAKLNTVLMARFPDHCPGLIEAVHVGGDEVRGKRKVPGVVLTCPHNPKHDDDECWQVHPELMPEEFKWRKRQRAAFLSAGPMQHYGAGAMQFAQAQGVPSDQRQLAMSAFAFPQQLISPLAVPQFCAAPTQAGPVAAQQAVAPIVAAPMQPAQKSGFKYCVFCHRPGHTEDDCYTKFPEKRAAWLQQRIAQTQAQGAAAPRV